MSHTPTDRRNAERPVKSRTEQKAPPPLRTVTPEQFDRLDRTMAQQGRPKLPRFQTGSIS